MDNKEWEVQAGKFGKKLAKLRTERSVTQESLSFDVGVDRTYISLLERGLRNPTLKRLWQISKVLKVSMRMIDRVKQRFVEDGFGCRAYRMTTILTDVILSSDSVIVGGHLLAFRASYTLRIASLKQELKARIIIWKLVLKVFNRILFSCHFAPLCEYYNREVTVCQGIVTGNYTGRGRTAGDKGEKKGGRPDAIGTPREKNMERKVIMAHCGSVKAVFGFLRLLAVKFGEKTLGELAGK